MSAILKIGALEIPNRAALDLEQTYEPMGGETTLRTIDGTGIKQTTWAKTRITITGGGWMPPGLSALDTAGQLVVACIVPRAINCDASRQATLPTGRRSDSGHTPWAWAIMPDGSVLASEVSIVSHVATVAAVTGAVGYQVLYYPQLTCWVNRPTESGSRTEGGWHWSITAEEV